MNNVISFLEAKRKREKVKSQSTEPVKEPFKMELSKEVPEGSFEKDMRNFRFMRMLPALLAIVNTKGLPDPYPPDPPPPMAA